MTMQRNFENVAQGAATVATVATLSNRLWCILSTSGGKTLPLVRSLTAAGIEAWAPIRTIRRPAPGQRRTLALGLRRRMIEVDLPILPGFVFVCAEYIDDIARITINPVNGHPSFSLFQLAGQYPLVGDASIAGLREAESEAAAMIQNLRDAESREEARRNRAEQMRTDAQRRAALRRQRKDFKEGDPVGVIDMPAMVGKFGKVVKSTGTVVTIDFGERNPMKVEAWRVVPSALLDGHAE